MKRLLVLFCLCPLVGWGEWMTKTLSYTFEGTTFEGRLVYNDSVKTVRPGVVMVPNWLGPTDASFEKAKKVAGDRYVVFMVDMYGVDVRPQNAKEAGAAAGAVRADRPMMRRRINKAVDIMIEQAEHVPLDKNKLAAIGFCFGGGTVLELARSGREIGGVVSFHGNLDTPDASDAQNIACKVLVLHGADDPYVPPAQVDAFREEMSAAQVDWQLIAYGGAVHSFTDPNAKAPGKAEFHPVVNRRSFQAMEQFFAELFE